MLLLIFITFLSLFLNLSYELYADDFKAIYNHPIPGTGGQPWPTPLYMESVEQFIVVNPHSISVHNSLYCEVLELAVKRILTNIYRLAGDRILTNRVDYVQGEDFTIIKMEYSICEDWPHANMNEAYNFTVNDYGIITIKAEAVWGVIRALETVTHLLHWDDNRGSFMINVTDVVDSPRYPHRGILLDTSRHFLQPSVIIQNLEAMAQNKMNVFHWHIVDDQSFPFFSEAYPDLSQKGAYSNDHYYTTHDVKNVLEEARYRGIRVMMEFDTPGHTLSWGEGHPELLTTCYHKDHRNKFVAESLSGPINPIANTTYQFLDKFFDEIFRRFPESYLHLGGDEVIFSCWASNPAIQKFMREQNWNNSFALLENYYINRLMSMLRNKDHSRRYVVWQEIFDNGLKLGPDATVHIWKRVDWTKEIRKVVKSGHSVILSSPWYLDYISYGADWKTYYLTEPLDGLNLTDDEQSLILGGEACLWGEYVDATNLLSRLWPRASAVAERLWSPNYYDNATEAASRLQEQRCRMIKLGIPAQPILGPGYCQSELA